jgi:hypothetical protein
MFEVLCPSEAKLCAAFISCRGFKVLPPSLKPWVIVAGPELEHYGYVQSTFLLMKG